MLNKEDKTILQDYEEVLKKLEKLEKNLENKSNNEIRSTLLNIIKAGWNQINTMYGMKEVKDRKLTKEQVQKHFNEMLTLAPITRINNTNNDNT